MTRSLVKSQPPPSPRLGGTAFRVDAKPVLITIVLIVIGVSASVWVLSRTIDPPPIPPGPESIESLADSAPAPPPSTTPSVSQPGARPPTANATRSAARNTEDVARVAARADRADRATADQSSPPLARGPTTGGDPERRTANTQSADLLTSSDVPAETLVVAASDDPSIYSRSDPDVVPPVALARQPLGRLPRGMGISNLSRIEVIVNENGTVAQVKAQETPQSLDDAMILTMSLSAAKAWLFEPALRDGRPVKYRALITVSIR